jgi:hypothetical protein
MAEQKGFEIDTKAGSGIKKTMLIASSHNLQKPPVAPGLSGRPGDQHSEGKEILREEITAEMNKLMNESDSEEGIEQVFFTKYVMQ